MNDQKCHNDRETCCPKVCTSVCQSFPFKLKEVSLLTGICHPHFYSLQFFGFFDHKNLRFRVRGWNSKLTTVWTPLVKRSMWMWLRNRGFCFRIVCWLTVDHFSARQSLTVQYVVEMLCTSRVVVQCSLCLLVAFFCMQYFCEFCTLCSTFFIFCIILYNIFCVFFSQIRDDFIQHSLRQFPSQYTASCCFCVQLCFFLLKIAVFLQLFDRYVLVNWQFISKCDDVR